MRNHLVGSIAAQFLVPKGILFTSVKLRKKKHCFRTDNRSRRKDSKIRISHLSVTHGSTNISCIHFLLSHNKSCWFLQFHNSSVLCSAHPFLNPVIVFDKWCDWKQITLYLDWNKTHIRSEIKPCFKGLWRN